MFISSFGREGVIYGVYEFARKVLGAEYFGPLEWDIPELETAELFEEDIIRKPEFFNEQEYAKKKIDIEALIKKYNLEALRDALSDGNLTQEEIEKAGFTFANANVLILPSYSGRYLEDVAPHLKKSIFDVYKQIE